MAIGFERRGGWAIGRAVASWGYGGVYQPQPQPVVPIQPRPTQVKGGGAAGTFSTGGGGGFFTVNFPPRDVCGPDLDPCDVVRKGFQFATQESLATQLEEEVDLPPPEIVEQVSDAPEWAGLAVNTIAAELKRKLRQEAEAAERERRERWEQELDTARRSMAQEMRDSLEVERKRLEAEAAALRIDWARVKQRLEQDWQQRRQADREQFERLWQQQQQQLAAEERRREQLSAAELARLDAEIERLSHLVDDAERSMDLERLWTVALVAGAIVAGGLIIWWLFRDDSQSATGEPASDLG